MALEALNHETLQKIIVRLDQALYNHQQWFNALIRTLICKLSPDQHDLNPEAHKECRFGQWYYNDVLKDLSDHPGVKALGEEHMRMHQLARALLEKVNSSAPISPPEYDGFSNALDRLRLEIANLKRELESLVYNRDPLTGATNRVSMLPYLREQQEISKRENKPCFLCMLDLDNFKQVNDTHGHSAGDSVLTALSNLVLQRLPPNGRVFRYGGEEFLICLPSCDANNAGTLIETIRKSLADANIISNPDVRITASFGLAQLDPNISVEDSIQRSDKALLAAKAAGKNNIQSWKA